MKSILIFLSVSILTTCFAQQPLYKNPTLPVEVRVNDLLQRMTLEEQAAQLYGMFSRDTLAFDENGNFIGTRDTAMLNHGIGSYASWGF